MSRKKSAVAVIPHSDSNHSPDNPFSRRATPQNPLLRGAGSAPTELGNRGGANIVSPRRASDGGNSAAQAGIRRPTGPNQTTGGYVGYMQQSSPRDSSIDEVHVTPRSDTTPRVVHSQSPTKASSMDRRDNAPRDRYARQTNPISYDTMAQGKYASSHSNGDRRPPSKRGEDYDDAEEEEEEYSLDNSQSPYSEELLKKGEDSDDERSKRLWTCLNCDMENIADESFCYRCAYVRGATGSRGAQAKVNYR
jgi:hypothetical protein